MGPQMPFGLRVDLMASCGKRLVEVRESCPLAPWRGSAFLAQHYNVGSDSGHPDLLGEGIRDRQGAGDLRVNLILRGTVCVCPCHACGHIDPSCSAPPLSGGAHTA